MKNTYLSAALLVVVMSLTSCKETTEVKEETTIEVIETPEVSEEVMLEDDAEAIEGSQAEGEVEDASLLEE